MVNELLLIGFLSQAWREVYADHSEDQSHDYLMLNCYHMIENPMRRKPRNIPKWLWLLTYQRLYSRKINALILKDMGKKMFKKAKQELDTSGL